MKNKLKKLIDIEGLYDFWKEQVCVLEKKEQKLIVADFDYTLFSRDEQLENEPGLSDNRGDDGPKFIFGEVGMTNFLNKYYKDKHIPKDIVKKMNPETDIILTAGIYEFQKEKINMCKELDNYKVIITKNGEDKIIALIRYVIFDLKFIPSKITVYEDRPQFFIEYRDLIEDVLGIKLEIIYVKMNGNNGYKKLELV